MKIITLLFSLVALAAKGQQPWVFTQGQAGHDAWISDIAWNADEAIATCVYSESTVQPPFAGSIIRLSTSGTLINERLLASGLNHVSPSVILPGPDQRLHILGSYRISADSLAGFFHFGCLMDGTVQDSSFILSADARKTTLENATFTNAGTMVLGGSVAFTTPGPFKYSQLISLDLNGNYITSNTFGSSLLTHYQLTRDVVPQPDGVLISVEQYPETRALFGIYSENLNPTEYWYGQGPHLDPLAINDSTIKGAMSLRSLGNGQYIVGGAFLAPSPGYRSAVYEMDTTGATLATFIPRSTYFHDHAAIQGCIASIDTGTFYYLAWENFSATPVHPPYTPVEADALHVYKLDNDLNVLCDYQLDGFVDNTYYLPIRIKTAPDGGFVIVGGRKNMNDPNSNFQAWAQKFDTEDCTVGISTIGKVDASRAYPNPGQDGFEVMLNGPGLSGGRIAVYDARGTVVAEESMKGVTVKVDCSQLPVGLYIYRIIDHDGVMHASGRWMKQ